MNCKDHRTPGQTIPESIRHLPPTNSSRLATAGQPPVSLAHRKVIRERGTRSQPGRHAAHFHGFSVPLCGMTILMQKVGYKAVRTEINDITDSFEQRFPKHKGQVLRKGQANDAVLVTPFLQRPCPTRASLAFLG
jgi:hypothetical protein